MRSRRAAIHLSKMSKIKITFIKYIQGRALGLGELPKKIGQSWGFVPTGFRLF